MSFQGMILYYNETRFSGDWDPLWLCSQWPPTLQRDPIFRGLRRSRVHCIAFIFITTRPDFQGIETRFRCSFFRLYELLQRDPIFRGLRRLWKKPLLHYQSLQRDPIFRGLRRELHFSHYLQLELQRDPIFRGLRPTPSTRNTPKRRLQRDPIFRGLRLLFCIIATKTIHYNETRFSGDWDRHQERFVGALKLQRDPIFRGLRHLIEYLWRELALLQRDPIFRGLRPP